MDLVAILSTDVLPYTNLFLNKKKEKNNKILPMILNRDFNLLFMFPNHRGRAGQGRCVCFLSVGFSRLKLEPMACNQRLDREKKMSPVTGRGQIEMELLQDHR